MSASICQLNTKPADGGSNATGTAALLVAIHFRGTRDAIWAGLVSYYVISAATYEPHGQNVPTVSTQ